MTNLIRNWLKPDQVVDSGIYLLCMGDVESINNLETMEITVFESSDGFIDATDQRGSDVWEYHPSFKLAKLEFK